MSTPHGVLGIGIDLVENERMREALERQGERFKERVFLESERAYCESRAAPWRHYAGRFAVKEAVSKAFGTGIGQHVGWLDIEVVLNEVGAPSVQLGGAGRDLANEREVQAIHVSLSHTHHYTVAQALLLG